MLVGKSKRRNTILKAAQKSTEKMLLSPAAAPQRS